MNNVFRYIMMLLTYTDPAGDVAGVIKNCRGETVHNVEVCVQELNGRTQCIHTGLFGEYWIRRIPEGKVGVFVSSDKWHTTRYRDVHVRPKQITEINFVLTPAPRKEFWCKE